jgi:hypothetical protein
MEYATTEPLAVLTDIIKRKARKDAKSAKIQQNFFTAETQRKLKLA